MDTISIVPLSVTEHFAGTRSGNRLMRPFTIRGCIIDSWVEWSGTSSSARRVVLQVAPQESPRELVIVEAPPSLLPDVGWLEDLGSNLCHGNPVSAVGRLDTDGRLTASQLVFER